MTAREKIIILLNAGYRVYDRNKFETYVSHNSDTRKVITYGGKSYEKSEFDNKRLVDIIPEGKPRRYYKVGHIVQVHPAIKKDPLYAKSGIHESITKGYHEIIGYEGFVYDLGKGIKIPGEYLVPYVEDTDQIQQLRDEIEKLKEEKNKIIAAVTKLLDKE